MSDNARALSREGRAYNATNAQKLAPVKRRSCDLPRCKYLPPEYAALEIRHCAKIVAQCQQSILTTDPIPADTESALRQDTGAAGEYRCELMRKWCT